MSDAPTRERSQCPDWVLIISDIPERSRWLGLALEPLGRGVVRATTDEAPLHGALGDVAVVVLDAAPAGFEAARNIRAQQRTVTTPVVLVTDDAEAVASTLTADDLLGVDVVPASAPPAELRSRVALLAHLSTELRTLARQAERQAAVLDAQQTVVRALTRGEADEIVLPRMARTIALRFGWDASAYWTASGSAARCEAMWFDPTVDPGARERLKAAAIHRHGDSVVHRAWASGAPEWALLSDPDGQEYLQAAHEAGLVCALAVPVTVSSGRSGVIELLSRSPDRPERQMIASLTSVAALIGRVLDARRAHEEAESLKNGFFALVTHELLTPLTSILGYLEEMIIDDPANLTTAQRQDLETIDRNAHRLNQLVHDLIFAAQIEAGQLSLELTNVDMVEVVEEVVEAARWSAQKRHIEIELRATPVRNVDGDRRRLGQAVSNLVSNAVKFSHDGGRVEVMLEPSGSEIVIEVTDQGIGIPAAERERVFDRYFRSSLGMANETPGAGLGLTICKAIVEAHGGSIALEDAVEGCTFRIVLPLRAAAGGGLDRDAGEMR